jgi:hypothetical protein
MECRITSTRSARRTASGMLLAEALVAMSIIAIVMMAVCSFTVFSGQSIAQLYNYVDLDDANRTTIDQLTRDVRQANRVISCTTNALVLEDADGLSIQYAYNPGTHIVTRLRNGIQTRVLKDCERLEFTIGQRNTQTGGYDVFAATSPLTAKVVKVAWMCSRTIRGVQKNTESVQTAFIVIRKQGA